MKYPAYYNCDSTSPLSLVNLKIKIQSMSCLGSVSYIWEVLPQSLYSNTQLNAQEMF